jgi:ankyrin repeat protein
MSLWKGVFGSKEPQEANTAKVGPGSAPAVRTQSSPQRAANGTPSADELTKAVLRRDGDAVQVLLSKGADVNGKASNGNPALIQASANGYRDMMQLLLSKGANVNVKGVKGSTALMAAATSRAYMGVASSGLPVVQMLLDAGADVHAKTEDGKTALEFAHKVKDDQVIEAILRAEGRGRPYTPELDMTDKAKWGFLDNIPSKTSLHEAVSKGDKDLVKSLLGSEGIDVNAEYMGSSPLYGAVDRRYKEIAEMLLVHGADVNAMGLFGSETPLQNAATRGGGFPRKVDKELVKMLLAHGADVNASKDKDWTPLHQVAQDGSKDIAELLLVNKVNLDAKGSKCWTPLHRAAMKGHRDMVEMLLAHGANINAKDKDGLSPADWAVKNGHKDVAELLLQHGGQS